MTKSFLLLASGLLATAPLFAAVSIIPEPHPGARYDKMVEKSPFAIATAAAAPVDAGPGPFANLYVAGVAKMPDSEGKLKNYVTIKSRADQTSFSIFGDEPGKDGISVADVQWSDHIGKTKVTLKKGSDFGTLEFDQAVTAPPPVAAPVMPRPPGIPGNARLPVPGAQTLPAATNPLIGGQKNINRIQPVVPRPTNVAPVANQPQAIPLPGQQPAGGVMPTDQRRRQRVINSKP